MLSNNINELIRIDRNTIHNYNNFDKFGGRTGDVIRSLLMYFAKERSNNIFGFGVLDPVKFAQEMKFEYKHLIEKAEKPYQFQYLNESEIGNLYELEKNNPIEYHVFDNVLENSLFILLTNSLLFNDYIVKESFINTKKWKLQSFLVLKELSFFVKKSKTNKYFYKYTLAEDFINNLITYFSFSNITTFANLKKGNLDGLYLFVNSFLEEMVNKSIKEKYLDFDELCLRGKIFATEPRNQKTKLKEKLNKLKKELNFDYTFVKKNLDAKFKYKILLTNNNIDNDKIIKENIEKKIRILFENTLKQELLKMWKSLIDDDYNDDNIEIDFTNWIKKGELVNVKEKEAVYKITYIKIYGNIPTYFNTIFNAYLRDCKN